MKDGALYFASEAKSLLGQGLVEARMDVASLHDFLALGHSIAPRTCWRDLHSLPPGSWLEFSPEVAVYGRAYHADSGNEADLLPEYSATLSTRLIKAYPFERWGIDRYQQERIRIDVMYKHPDNQRIVDEYKNILIDCNRKGAINQLENARLTRLKTLSVRNKIPGALFYTLDEMLKHDKLVDLDEQDYLAETRQVLEGIFLTEAQIDAGINAEGDHVFSTSSMRLPIHRMTLTAMLLPSARPPPAQTRQGDPRGFDGGLPASELRGLGAGTGRERVGGWVQGIPRETF